MVLKYFSCLGILLCFFSLGCSGDKKSIKDKTNNTSISYPSPNKREVQGIILKKSTFQDEILANGRLIARQKNTLKFEVSGILNELNVKNGDKVPKGTALASLEKFEYQQAVNKAELDFKRSDLDFKDILVSRGYNPQFRDSIPTSIFEMAGIRSGFLDTKRELSLTKHRLNQATLTSPYPGKVANIKYSKHEKVISNTEFLTLIDDSQFNVEFKLTEDEISKVKLNETVLVEVLTSNSFLEGKITSINPVVDSNGLVLVKAQVNNNGSMIDGMNVNISINKEIPNQFVVPKNAVTLRQGEEVIFKHQNGKAYWTYIQSIYENSQYYAITPNPDKSSVPLREGDTIIVSNNLDLAHDVKISLELIK